MSGNSRFNLDEYEPVEDRLVKFWDKYPTGRIETQLTNSDANQFVFVVHLYRTSDVEELAFSTGWAQEVVGQGMVNKTSALENCETSAIGRALANGGFASKLSKRPSREEMEKVARAEAKPTPKKGDEEYEMAFAASTGAYLITDKASLRSFWKANTAYLDVEITMDKKKTTLRSILNELGKELPDKNVSE